MTRCTAAVEMRPKGLHKHLPPHTVINSPSGFAPNYELKA
ncbi:MAG: hypothetical protein GDYSWBUE_000366 [Candidatus Fervidibacterota bacterium]